VSSQLFTIPLRAHLEEIEKGLAQHVKQLSEDDLLGSPSSTLAEGMLENALPPVPVLEQEYAIDRIPGRSVVDFRVPVSGDETLLSYAPSKRPSVVPTGCLSEGSLLISIPMFEQDAMAIEDAFEKEVWATQHWLQQLEKELNAFRAALLERLTNQIEERKTRAQTERGIFRELQERRQQSEEGS
jgi:hypothetical protein